MRLSNLVALGTGVVTIFDLSHLIWLQISTERACGEMKSCFIMAKRDCLSGNHMSWFGILLLHLRGVGNLEVALEALIYGISVALGNASSGCLFLTAGLGCCMSKT